MEHTTDDYINSLYTLIFAERVREGGVAESIVGPTLHASEELALKEVFCYVENRIHEAFSDEHAEWVQENILSGMTENERLQRTVDWYFDFSNDDEVEAFYRIDPHRKEIPSPSAGTQVLADFQIQDWHLTEIGEHWEGPNEFGRIFALRRSCLTAYGRMVGHWKSLCVPLGGVGQTEKLSHLE